MIFYKQVHIIERTKTIFTAVCIFKPEFGLIPRYFALHLTENGNVFFKHRSPLSYESSLDACKEYARRWVKKEYVEVDTLSALIKSIADVLKRRIRQLKHSVNTRHKSIFSDHDSFRELPRLYENFVVVPADKTSNNYTFVCNSITSASWERNSDLSHSLRTLHTISRIFLHQKCWTTTNRSSLHLE